VVVRFVGGRLELTGPVFGEELNEDEDSKNEICKQMVQDESELNDGL
jgi:hypothetical protein